MPIYCYKIFSNLYCKYLTDDGSHTWFDIPSVAKVFNAITQKENVEIHRLLLTSIVDLTQDED